MMMIRRTTMTTMTTTKKKRTLSRKIQPSNQLETGDRKKGRREFAVRKEAGETKFISDYKRNPEEHRYVLFYEHINRCSSVSRQNPITLDTLSPLFDPRLDLDRSHRLSHNPISVCLSISAYKFLALYISLYLSL